MKNSLYSRRHNPAKFLDMYEMGKKLGEGNFAQVFEVVSKKDQASQKQRKKKKKKN
jgi:serine/threonine protein kinase